MLIPLAYVITPNVFEAEKLSGIKIKTKMDLKKSAQKIKKIGAKNVVITGNLFDKGKISDYVLEDSRHYFLTGKKLPIVNHGSGCNFSSALTVAIAKGNNFSNAVKFAKEYAYNSIKNSIQIGKGISISNTIAKNKNGENILGKAIKNYFGTLFPTPDSLKKTETESPYLPMIKWFQKGNKIDLLSNLSNNEYKKKLKLIPGLFDVVNTHFPKDNAETKILLMEFVLFGLSEHSLLSRYRLENGIQFKDMLSTMFTMPADDYSEDDDSTLFRE